MQTAATVSGVRLILSIINGSDIVHNVSNKVQGSRLFSFQSKRKINKGERDFKL